MYVKSMDMMRWKNMDVWWEIGFGLGVGKGEGGRGRGRGRGK
jgi:hypothetical protein